MTDRAVFRAFLAVLVSALVGCGVAYELNGAVAVTYYGVGCSFGVVVGFLFLLVGISDG